tara:strand:+ start:171 stop:605 length:435 start_codon:yes stop_codon:yes gene_type:complete
MAVDKPDDNDDRKKRDEARRKKKQRINQKKQIDAANKRNEDYLKEESKYYRKQDPNAQIFNKDGQEVADDGSIIVDDSPVTGPVIEPAEGDYDLDEFGNPVYNASSKAIKNILKYGLPVKSTYSGVAQVGMSGMKFLRLINQLN